MIERSIGRGARERMTEQAAAGEFDPLVVDPRAAAGRDDAARDQ
jgi:hypothetical protein